MPTQKPRKDFSTKNPEPLPSSQKSNVKEEERSKAPIIILGTMVVMSIITISFVFVAHLQRTEPYLDSKMRVVRHKQEVFVPILSLNYVEFGPQAMAIDLVGPQWWQWLLHGDSDPKTAYDVKIVVYYGLSEEEVAIDYPIDDRKFMDHRYIKLDSALDYLEAHIKENALSSVTAQLTATREKILDHFYEAP